MKPQWSEHHVPILRSVLIAAMILFAAIVRMVPHPWNFAPIGAMALFSGATIRNRVLAFVFPMLALLAGDLVVGFHILMPAVYVSFLVSIAIGFWLRERRSVQRVGGAVSLGAIQFFLMTNLGVWMFLGTYPKTAAGLVACYVAGIPFFWNTLAGDALYSTILFGTLYLTEHAYPTQMGIAGTEPI